MMTCQNRRESVFSGVGSGKKLPIARKILIKEDRIAIRRCFRALVFRIYL